MDYALNMSSVQLTSSGFTGSLVSGRWPLQPALELRADVLPHGNLRVRVRENAAGALYSRYEVRDVLMVTEQQIATAAENGVAPKTTWSTGELGLIGSFSVGEGGGMNVEVHVQARPLVITTVVNGQIQLQANARNLLNFEQYRKSNPKPSPPPPPAQPADAAAPAADGSDAAAVDAAAAAAAASAPPTEPAAPVDSPPQVFPYDEDGMWSESWGSHTDSRPRGPASISLDVTFTGRHVYGLPEHASSFALKSTRGASSGDYSEPYRLFNLDVFEFELNEPMSLYGAVPFIMGHTLGGTAAVLWLNSAETFVDITDGQDVDGRPLKETHWISESGIIDVFFIPGPIPAAVFQQYAALTGTATLPPRFAIAYHQCRWNYRSEDDVAGVDGGFDTHDIPYDVLWLDIEHTDGKKYFTWDNTNFPTPKTMQEKLAVKGRKMVTIVDPHIKRDSNYRVHNEMTAGGHYVKQKDGSSVYEGWCWPGSVSYPDFTEPGVREFWAQQFAYQTYDGSTPSLYTWNDMNEPSVFNGPEVTMPKDCLHGHGTVEHRDVHNLYGFYVQMATYDGQLRRNSPANDRPFVLTRAFFAGTQRYGAVWTGDNKADWGHLASTSPMLLSLGVGGITFSGADVGGFFGDPDAELQTRWYQAAAYQPFFRGHAHIDTKRREPWLFGEPYTTHIRNAIRERYALLPYIYTTFYQSSQTGMPVLRPLWSLFVSDTQTHTIDTTFLLGDGILVAPVTANGERTNLVYLPANPGQSQRWYDVRTYTPYTGGQTVNVAAPLDFIPAFYRGGSIIARRNRPRRSSALMEQDPFTLVVALDSEQASTGALYLDDGRSFDYERGASLLKTYRFAANTLTSASGNRTATATLPQFSTPVTVERIVIVGLSGKVNQVQVTDEIGTTSTLTFIQEENSLTIRKPNVKIEADWTVQLS